MTANGNVVYGLSPCKRPCSATQWGAEVAQNHAVPHNTLTSKDLHLHTGNQRISRRTFFMRKQRNLKPPSEIRMKANQPKRRQYDTRQKNITKSTIIRQKRGYIKNKTKNKSTIKKNK